MLVIFLDLRRMAIRITLECGHTSMLRARTTPEGYTHDWDLYVRGVDNADISQYIKKGRVVALTWGIVLLTIVSYYRSIAK